MKKYLFFIFLCLTIQSPVFAILKIYRYQIIIKNNGSQYYLPDVHPQGNFFVGVAGFFPRLHTFVHCFPVRCLHSEGHYATRKVIHFGQTETIDIHTHNRGLKNMMVALVSARLHNGFQDGGYVVFMSNGDNLPSVIMMDSSEPPPVSPSFQTMVENCHSLPHNETCTRY